MHALNLSFNLVDFLMLGVIIRGCYVGAKSGLLPEAFRLFSVICSTFIIVHYYPALSQFLREKLFVSERTHEFVAFIIWMGISFLVFFLIREGWLLFFRAESPSPFNKWMGCLLSLVTSYFVCGLIFLALVLLNYGYVYDRVKSSFSRTIWHKTSGRVYVAGYGIFVRPFFPDEKPNEPISNFVMGSSGD